jgi:hypothetical protein
MRTYSMGNRPVWRRVGYLVWFTIDLSRAFLTVAEWINTVLYPMPPSLEVTGGEWNEVTLNKLKR